MIYDALYRTDQFNLYRTHKASCFNQLRAISMRNNVDGSIKDTSMFNDDDDEDEDEGEETSTMKKRKRRGRRRR